MQHTRVIEVQRVKLANAPEFADAHCHLNLIKDVKGAIKDAKEKGVRIILATGGSAKDNVETARIAGSDSVFGIVGIGPDFAAKDYGSLKEIERMIRGNHHIVGIGEIGLDTTVTDKNPMNMQKEVFTNQVALANDLDLPVVIHCRGALAEVTKILDEMLVKKALFHFFEGDEIQAAELCEKGYFISIPPAETSKRKRIIKSINLNYIVAETDSPIVGKTPADVIKVCETIAKIRGVSLEEVATKTTENIRRLFYI